jgi:glutamate synthase (NADPH/NADH) large chain
MMLIPEAWQDNEQMEEWKKAFYEYHDCIMEPWDGPASICFTDGKMVGATLDRNGLSPSRFVVYKDGRVVMSSEAGALANGRRISHTKRKIATWKNVYYKHGRRKNNRR